MSSAFLMSGRARYRRWNSSRVRWSPASRETSDSVRVAMGGTSPSSLPWQRWLRKRLHVRVQRADIVVSAAPVLAPGHLVRQALARRIGPFTHRAQELLLGPALDHPKIWAGRRALRDVLGV